MLETTQDLQELTEAVAATAHRLPQDGLTVAAGGNVSARDPDSGLIGITPTGLAYGSMTAEDVVVVDGDGRVVGGALRPSSEMPLHLDLMAAFVAEPRLAIVHTHSPYATAFSVARRSIPLVCNEGLMLGAAQVEVTAYAPPGTPDLGRAVLDVLDRHPEARAILIANHGAVTIAPTVTGAYDLALQLEWSARIYHLALQIGQPHELTAEQMASILARYHGRADTAD